MISVTQFHAGDATNIVPDSAWIGGTVRTFTIPVLDLIERRMEEVEKVMENLAELGMEPIMSAATRRSHARTVEAAIQPADGINPSFEDALKLLSEKVVKGLNSS